MKKSLSVLLAGFFLFSVCGIVSANGDDPADAPALFESMPVLGAGEYGTDIDNENNAGTGVADGDMDIYIFNSNTKHPVEFNIKVPIDPSGQVATLRMDVYDIDTPGEVDKVYLNGTLLGTLNGSNGTWGVNIFTIPPNVVVQGKNLVKIVVDVNNGGWATTIDWGIIKLQNLLAIPRGWVAPVVTKAGKPVNFFAEVSGKPTSVKAYYGGLFLVKMTDPDKDGIYSGSYTIPRGVSAGYYKDLTYEATDGVKTVKWPGITIVR